jgi:hypothetical protein
MVQQIAHTTITNVTGEELHLRAVTRHDEGASTTGGHAVMLRAPLLPADRFF